MPFVSLKTVRDQVWPAAIGKGLATDMTGVSWPVLDFDPASRPPFRVLFMLFYAVRSETNPGASPQITEPYALLRFDLETGGLVSVEKLVPEVEAVTIIGPSASAEVQDLPSSEFRAARELLLRLTDQVAEAYVSGSRSAEQVGLLKDWLALFTRLAEPPLLTHYARVGERFFSWARTQTQPTSAAN